MSKEETPIEIIKVMLENEVAITIDHVNNLLTKEKEQIEELIKKTYADALINLTMFEEGKISKEEMEMIYKRAEQYYNEVIKGRN
jgi:hypothetical protein